MKAIILAAGIGSRLRPLTTHRPKHLLEIGGKSILHRTLDQLVLENTIDQVIVVVNYHADMIRDAISSWYPQNDNIVIINQEDPKGTGDAVDVALQKTEIEDPFIVINGDVLFGERLQNFIQSDWQDGLIVGAKVDNPSAFGVIHQDKSQLLRIEEKPENPPTGAVINAGFYIFPSQSKELFANLGYSERGEREMTEVLDQLVQANSSITVYETKEGWFDIGHPWQILDANQFFMDKEQEQYEVLSDLEPNVQINGNVHVAASARIRSGVYIEGPVYIDEGADIGPNCYIRGRTYLGKETRVGNACEIKNSVIYEDTHAAHLSYVGDSILGRSCNLGAGTITANLRHDGKDIKLTVKGDRISTGRRKLGVVMGDYVKTGIGVDILPGVKISPKTWLNAGEVILRDV